MKLEIIEDCSPFYIRMTHSNIQDVIDVGLDVAHQHAGFFNEEAPARKLGHVRLSQHQERVVYNASPFSFIGSKTYHTSMLYARPGSYYVAHKDGLCNRVGINYYIEVYDDKCRTNWYDESVCDDYDIINDGAYTRELRGFNPDLFTPAKTATFKQGECILINVDIYHDFDNRLSVNSRKLLSLRTINECDIYFDTAKRALFGM